MKEKIFEQIKELSHTIYHKELDLKRTVNSDRFDICDTMNLCLEIMLLQSRLIALKELVLDPDPKEKSNQNIN